MGPRSETGLSLAPGKGWCSPRAAPARAMSRERWRYPLRIDLVSLDCVRHGLRLHVTELRQSRQRGNGNVFRVDLEMSPQRRASVRTAKPIRAQRDERR